MQLIDDARQNLITRQPRRVAHLRTRSDPVALGETRLNYEGRGYRDDA
jgi:hypothetical protein